MELEPTKPNEANEARKEIGEKVIDAYKRTKSAFDKEAKRYIECFRHEFNGALPERMMSADRVDINVVYQHVKALIPTLYFKNPKVFIKALQAKIVHPVVEEVETETGEEQLVPVIGDDGKPLVKEYDAANSALVLQSAINQDIIRTKMKKEVKMAIQDAILTPYGAIKEGWGNDQGVAAMGEGAPPSIREEVYEDGPYAIRLKPWDVVVDPCDFDHPEWIAVRYLVPPEQLKNDTRLNYRDQIKGVTKLDLEDKKSDKSYLSGKEKPMVEYFEVFVKPCAKYPQGYYVMFTDEVKEDFLFQSEWPTASKSFPVKILAFNIDPEGGLPIPDIRYIMGHQKAKLNLRNTEYEWVQRTLPMLYINSGGMKDFEKVAKQIQSGQIPRVITGSQPANRAVGPVGFPGLPTDFRALDANIDRDIDKVMRSPGNASLNNDPNQLAVGLKIASSAEAAAQSERSDIVTDFIRDILAYWMDLYKEFASAENYSAVEGESFPIGWSREEIQGKFDLEVKPFSMSYEDPVILRRQYIDLLNLLAAQPIQMWLKEQGYAVDVAKIVRRILETYDERDVDSFVFNQQALPEMQVMDALKENEALAIGDFQAAAVLPEDNHKLHILIHTLAGDVASQHILEHQQAMMNTSAVGSPGGGNPEGLPTNGVAADQEMMREPLQPSSQNMANRIGGNPPTNTR